MSGRLRLNPVGATIVVVALICVIALLAVFAPRWWGGRGGTFAPSSVAIRTHVAPSASLFGDVVTLRADVLVNTAVLDPASTRLQARFTPFRLLRQERHVSRLGDRAARVEFAYRIQCVSSECLTMGAPRDPSGDTHATAIHLRDARLTVERRRGLPLTRAVGWAPITLQRRLTEHDLELGLPVAGDFPIVEPTFSVDPDLAGGLLVAAAVLLTALGSGLLVAAVRRRDPVRTLRLPAGLTPLRRALALVEEASSSGDVPGGRRALERLAKELERTGAPSLAATATHLAWSPRGPARADVDALVTQVQRAAAA